MTVTPELACEYHVRLAVDRNYIPARADNLDAKSHSLHRTENSAVAANTVNCQRTTSTTRQAVNPSRSTKVSRPRLNADGHLTIRGKAWTAVAVMRVLNRAA